MTAISKTFKQLKKQNEKALITYIMAGDPSIEATEQLIYALEEGGADIIELGVPFSDPLADGPVIQRASERALASKTNLMKVFNLVNRVREKSSIPIVLMTYYNIIYNYDERSFVTDALRAGVDGVIIPDLPPEECKPLIKQSRKEGLDLVFLLAPTSNDKRISLISAKSRGFIYYVSLKGVTGTRESLSSSVKPMVDKIKEATSKPVAVGFGISNAKQAAIAGAAADGVVIGSAIVKLIEENVDSDSMINSVRDFVNSIKLGMRHTPASFEEDTRILGDYLSETL
ncbi:MAG: tryptophan synthase subunit alpha [Deltaproteobacteria bacterium]|nr:tryptophan synthase subunit alpha [Deltaproteobacteria bacterium]